MDFFGLVLGLAEISTMGGVWWRPEPCRCLISHFQFVFIFGLYRNRFRGYDCCDIRGDGLLIAPSLGRLRPHLVCWPGFR